MKSMIVFSLLLAIVSCGKNSTSSDSHSTPEPEREEFAQASSTPMDLMNVTVDLPAEIHSGRIRFLRSANFTDQGKRKACSFQVNTDEIWDYRVSDRQLILERPDGSKLTFTRFKNIGPGAQGTWAWSGHTKGMKVFRRLFLLDGRFILNQDCEG